MALTSSEDLATPWLETWTSSDAPPRASVISMNLGIARRTAAAPLGHSMATPRPHPRDPERHAPHSNGTRLNCASPLLRCGQAPSLPATGRAPHLGTTPGTTTAGGAPLAPTNPGDTLRPAATPHPPGPAPGGHTALTPAPAVETTTSVTSSHRLPSTPPTHPARSGTSPSRASLSAARRLDPAPR
jgi:hypothetical protein